MTLAPQRMSRAVYDAIDAVHYSTLKEMRRSPLHYQHRDQTPMTPTSAMVMGSAVHTAVLEPDRFPLEYVVFDGPRRAGKVWDAFEEANQTKTILKVDEYERCLRIRDAVHAHPAARLVLSRGDAEQSFTWTDKDTGLLCKGRADWIGNGVLADLKVTHSLDPHLFAVTAYRMGTHIQQSFYRTGLANHGLTVYCRVIAVEPTEPYDVGVFSVGVDVLDVADEEVRHLLARVAQCRASGEWPGRFPDEVPLELPGWVYRDDGELDELGLTFGGAE